MIYDLIVIGGGPGGYLASERAAEAGLKVLCIERENLGGVCLNEGCIPTKTLLYSAKLFDGAKHGDKYGVSVDSIAIDHNKVVARKNKVVKMLVGGIRNTLKAKGVEVVNGIGRIKCISDDNFEVEAGDATYSAKHLIIATGSTSVIPPIEGVREGIEKGKILTNREILNLSEVPNKLVVVGGGVIGLEMASYYNSIGSQVTVVEMLDHIAGENDSELSEILRKNYEKRGIKFLLSTKVVRFTDTQVHCVSESGEQIELEYDYALMSVGRRANTDIGLENIGVAVERGAIITDPQMRTNVNNCYAVGDCNGKSMLAHTAYREAEVAVNNILGKADAIDYSRIPSVIYTNPELASVGETEATALKKGMDIRVKKLSMRFSGRYLAENEGGDGIFKLIVNNKDNRVVGAQALANYSSEFIVAVGVMIEANMTLEQVQKVVFPHPTVCEIIREAVFFEE
ncbi:MAG TPA: dihydrolipoyl dehydrogenase [Clostridiales bacterium]|jgi:dihydrolipoamide dehydrogenase|nr:dihydrolipoyl dehydrogenase [Clostridiales bacterium]